jgi:hypothetical protein
METAGFNDKTNLDLIGHPHSDDVPEIPAPEPLDDPNALGVRIAPLQPARVQENRSIRAEAFPTEESIQAGFGAPRRFLRRHR